MHFKCDKCGLCCKLLKRIPQLAAFDRGDGVCIHLKDNLCDIYPNRPMICNVEKMFSSFSKQMSEEEYLTMMQESCQFIKQHFNELQTEDW